MREIQTESISQALADICQEVCCQLGPDMEQALESALARESNAVGARVLEQLQENLQIARQEHIPICQDTGMAVVFVRLGQDAHIVGGMLEEAIHEGIRRGYSRAYLRKSVVSDPFLRQNTGDNTPAVIHYELVAGDGLELTLAPKGFGSENMSRICMLKPADGIEGAKEAVLEAIREAGANACPPLVVGVGVGGTFEKAALLAKKALLRPVGVRSPLEHIAQMEREILDRANSLGIGPGGLGGDCTALAVHIESYATHIAGLPLAVNMCCHANRHGVCRL